jgi:hypothetical protein
MEINLDRRVARAAAAVYVPITLAAAALFAVAAALQGRTGPATVAAGALWVALLTLIVLMPLVIPAARRRRGAPADQDSH